MNPIAQELIDKPYLIDFFEINGLALKETELTISEYAATIPYRKLENLGIDRERFEADYHMFIRRMEEIKQGIGITVESLTVIGGEDKDGAGEEGRVDIQTGETICINGVTGSGKTRLLEDIEWLAQGDTPTKRTVLVNNQPAPRALKYAVTNRLVAQLSQNLNFVMDVDVGGFLDQHAKCRLIDIDLDLQKEILDCANTLSGEIFDLKTPLTSLSGGQARALMVADIAYLSASPIVLIDEIENAGINKDQALNLLADQNKIVLMATHDPVFALSADQRIIMKNGGISRVARTTQQDKELLAAMKEMDRRLNEYREQIRTGEL
jgi:ABC-type lipoprotein export system ATPase subunit